MNTASFVDITVLVNLVSMFSILGPFVFLLVTVITVFLVLDDLYGWNIRFFTNLTSLF